MAARVDRGSIPPCKIVFRAPSSLIPSHDNPRVRSPAQLASIKDSFVRNGIYSGVVIDENSVVLAGHGRLQVALDLHLKEIPCFVVRHLTKAGKKALMLYDNRIAQDAIWDRKGLASVLTLIPQLQVDFQMDFTGFTTEELSFYSDTRVGSLQDQRTTKTLLDFRGPGVCRQGDLWRLGEHRLLCAPIERANLTKVLDRGKANLVTTDLRHAPEPIANAADGHTVSAAPERQTASLSNYEVQLTMLVGCTVPAATWVLFLDWIKFGELLASVRAAGLEPKDCCTWLRSGSGQSGSRASDHELALVLTSGSRAIAETDPRRRSARPKSNVWRHPPDPSEAIASDRPAPLVAFPKPERLLMDLIREHTRPKELILDPFLELNPTILAAESTGRRAAALERDPTLVDLAIRRWQARTGQDAVHVGTGRSFAALERDRLKTRQERKGRECHGERP